MPNAFKVYLAGPINGLSIDDCTGWRAYVEDELSRERLLAENLQIVAYSPMRAKEFLARMPILSGNPKEYPVESALEEQLAGSRGITGRDFNDVRTADVLFVNLLGAAIVSIGTMFEMAWAYQNQTPVVLVMENDGNIHEHAMLQQMYTYRVESLKEAIFLTRRILFP